MPLRFWGLCPVILLLLCSCSVEPSVFAPLPQRRMPVPLPFPGRLLAMNDPAVERHIVLDVARGPVEAWRWSGRNPTFQLRLEDVDALKLHVDFTIPEVTFKQTGPVTLTFQVNGRTLGTERYDTPGSRSWEAPVREGWLKAADDNTIGVLVDKMWVSPDDGSRLGIILSGIGLVH